MIKIALALLFWLGVSFSALAQPATTQPTSVLVPFTNSSSGTTVNKLVKLTSGQAVATATTDTDNSVGIAVNGAGTSGTVQVATGGITLCVFDGATTAGDYVQISSSTGGDCHDTGAATRPTSGQVIGRVLSTNGSGGTYALAVGLSVGAGGAVSSTTPTSQLFLTGTNATYTTPAAARWIEVWLWGDGGGGSGGGTGGGSGSPGTGTCWNSSGTACTTPLYEAGGGAAGGGSGGSGGAGGTISGSLTCNDSGAGGQGTGFGSGGSTLPGGAGGAAFGIGIIGPGAAPAGNAAPNAPANSGSGGGGGTTTASLIGNGAGGGALCHFIIGNPSSTYVYTVGPGGAKGAAGTSGGAGGNGGSGKIYVEEHYNP